MKTYNFTNDLPFLGTFTLKIFLSVVAALFSSAAFCQSFTVMLERCNASVTFSGAPTEVTNEITQHESDKMGVVSAWGYSSVLFGKRTQERVLCVCPSEPTLSSLRSEVNKVSRWNKEIVGIGMASISPIVDAQFCKNCRLLQNINPKSSPDCFVYQDVASEEDQVLLNRVSKDFFSSVKSIYLSDLEKNRQAKEIERLKQENLILQAAAEEARKKSNLALSPPARENDNARDLKERLKEVEAKEAANKRNKVLEVKQAAAREAAEKLEQKQADANRQLAQKIEAQRLAAEARNGDGSSGDAHCKALKLVPTTPKYLNCRKDFSNSETIAKRVEQENFRALEQAKVGDGTPEHQQCLKFGFIGSTPPYADCRLRLEMNKQQVAQRQEAYEAERQRYDEQVAAYEKEKERQKKLAQIRYGLALMGSTSPTFAGGIADANRAMGWAPPEPPKLQPFTIQGPKGTTTCTVIGNMYNCF